MEGRNAIFQKLKPLCIQLSQEALRPTGPATNSKAILDSLSQVHKVLTDLNASGEILDSKLADYVFFPISHVLKASQNLPVRALELSLQCVLVLLQTGWRIQLPPNLGGQLLILLTFMADSSPNNKMVTKTTEELQTVALACLGELFMSLCATPEGKRSLTATANVPALGAAINVMLEAVLTGASAEIQITALEALRSFCNNIRDRDVLASFMPGMVSCLAKILTPGPASKQPVRVLKSSIDLLSELFRLVVSDEVTADLPSTCGASEGDGDNVHPSQLTVSWLKATAAQLKVALGSIIKLRQHDRAEVRQALVRLCVTVLQNCRRSLEEAVGMMLETLVTIVGEHPQNTTEQTVNRMLTSDPDLAELLRSSLHGWVTSLPRVMQGQDDVPKRRVVSQISVSYRLLSEQMVDLTLVDRIMAANLRDSVFSAIHNSSSLATVVGSSPSGTSMALQSSNFTVKSTQFEPVIMSSTSQEETVGELQALLNQLGTSDSCLEITRDLIQSVRLNNGELKLASFWLSLHILKSYGTRSGFAEEIFDFGSSDSEEGELREELYSLSITAISESGENSGSDWRLQALALEAIAMHATKLQSEFQVELIDVLFPVLRLMGSGHQQLRSHAMTCLNIIADACGYGDVGELIVSNVDYLTNAVALKLNSFDITPQAPQVLLMMVKLSGPSLIPYLEDLVDSIFAALENFHGYTTLVELLFTVLRVIAEEGTKSPQLAITMGEHSSHTSQLHGPTSMAAVLEFLRKLKEKESASSASEKPEEFDIDFWKKKTEDSDVEQPETAMDEQQPSEDAPPPAPKTYALLLKISELTQHFLPSASPSLRTSLLSVLNTTFPTLAKHENSFLPLINTLWPTLVARLDDSEAYVIADTLEVIGLMCVHAGNFMLSRIREVWPKIKSLHRTKTTKAASSAAVKSANSLITSALETPSSSMIKGGNGNVSRETFYVDAPSRVIWEALVRFLTRVAEHPSVDDAIFNDMLDMVEPVLEDREDVRRAMEVRNADAVWLKLLQRRVAESADESTNPIGWSPLPCDDFHFIDIMVE